MTDYEQQIYDVIYDWWDIIFDINPPPVDRNGEYIDKNATIIDLVKSISEIQDKDDTPWLDTTYDGFMTHEEMLEVAAKREAMALESLDKLYKENDEGMKELANE